MRVLVTRENFLSVVEALCKQERISCDLETTGVYPFHGDKLFAVAIATKSDEFYFDFNINGELPRSFIILMQPIFDCVKYIKFINYKFDMSFLRNEGIRFPRSMRILDGGVAARVHYNLHQPVKGSDEGQFSMDYLAQYYLNIRKSDEVKKYIEEHQLYKIDVMGDKAPDFARVPTPIMFKYALSDARITYDIVERILCSINAADEQYAAERPPGTPLLMSVLARESALSFELFDAHYTGFKCDRAYVNKAITRDNELVEDMLKKIKPLTPDGFNFGSPDQLGKFLISKGVNLPMSTPKRNRTSTKPFKPKPKTDQATLDIALEGIDLPVIKYIREAKQAQKRVSTYYSNYLWMMDSNDVIHGNINQDGTVTGRCSSDSPNLQNLGKSKVWHEWAVRNSFMAFEDHYLACLDFSQQEMRVAADRANEQYVIQKIMAGLDYYDATGQVMEEIMGIHFERDTTKRVALGVTYEQGKALLAHNLKCSEVQAQTFKTQFLTAMPGIANMRKKLKERAERYGRIFTVYGRVIHIAPGFEYKALNAYIQGTSADMTKESIVRCGKIRHEFNAKSLFTCQVHDENIFNIHRDELYLVPLYQKAMVDSYPHTYLPMGAEADLSRSAWARKVKIEKFNDYYPELSA